MRGNRRSSKGSAASARPPPPTPACTSHLEALPVSRFSPTVLPQPVDYGAPVRDALQAFLAARGYRDQRDRQKMLDARAAQQQAFEDSMRTQQFGLEREQQDRLNATTGYTPGGEVTVPSGDLANAIGRSMAGAGIMGVAGAAGPAPTTTVTTPGTYDFTKSQSYQSAQAAATRAANAAQQRLRDEILLHQTNRDYDIAHPTATDRAALARSG